ncbi:MAG: LapA family protein [Paracoccaceae bacterium]
MIRTLRFVILATIGFVLLVVAMANRTPVTVQALPSDIGTFFGVSWSVELPLFLVMFGGMVVGLLIGFVWEWMREHKHRVVASTKGRDVARLEREIASMRDAKGQTQDDVLALLDTPRKAS